MLRHHAAVRWALGVAAGVAGIALVPSAFDPIHPSGDGPLWGRLLFVSVGWAFIGAGLWAWATRREKTTGPLLVAWGWATWVPLLLGTRVPLLWSLGAAIMFLSLPLSFWAILAFPEGRLNSRWDRLLVSVQVLNFVVRASEPLVYDPSAFGCTDCQAGLNLLNVRNDPELVRLNDTVTLTLGIAAFAALLVALTARWVRAAPPRRRILNPLLVPSVIWASSVLAYLVFQRLALVRIYDPPTATYHLLLLISTVALLLLPILYLVGLSRARGRRKKVADLVVELSDLPGPSKLKEALVRALGDPSLQLAVWNPEAESFVQPDNGLLALPVGDPSRAVTMLERQGEPLGAIVHDPALLDDSGLIAAVTAAARLSVENEKLQAQVLAQLAEVHRSRARIIEAADQERKRIERNLHDGAQQHLITMSLALQFAESTLDQNPGEARVALHDASRELDTALAELRELARGTYPAVLTDEGLIPALEALADRSPVPVELHLHGSSSTRLAERVEAAAYFMTAEALTNIAKYSRASRADLRVEVTGADLLIQISDNGVGGAEPSRGTGLSGLRDRVEALGGELEVRSAEGSGTIIEARVPCE